MQNRVGQRIGNYQLTGLLGRGSFGDVYLAKHVPDDTPAAVKVLQTRLTPEDLKLFINEASTSFKLQHPNIVRLLDFGIDANSTPFLVMAYAPNGTLRQRYPRGTRLSLDIIIPFVNQIAAALQYAHDKRLIHRDVKPENMLLGPINEVWLSDFGLAHIAHSSFSQSEVKMAGTIPYMAPEQIQSHPRPASDQYALGIVVYEWLCGDRPFEGTLTDVAVKQLMIPPPPLHEKIPTISPEVEQVVMTALAKDPRQRFGRVQAFAIALEQASQPPKVTPPHLPIMLTPPNQASRPPELIIPPAQSAPPSELITRPEHTAQATGMGIISNQTSQPPDLWTPASQASQPFSTYPPTNLLEASQAPGRISRRTMILGLGLAGLVVAGGGLAWLAFPRGQQAPSVFGQTPKPASSPGPTPTLIPPGSLLYTYPGHTNIVFAVAWSPDGRRIASGSYDHTVQVWDAADGSHAFTYRGHSSPVNAVAWSSDSRHIASGSNDHTVQVWDAADGSHVFTYKGHSDVVLALAWSPDGTRLASGGADQTVQVWDAADGGHVYSYTGHANSVDTVAWSPDGKRIASGSYDKTVQVWDAANGGHVYPYRGHSGYVHAVAWSPDSKRIASGSTDETVQVWNATDGSHAFTYRGHSALVNAVAWSPDGKHIASGSYDHTVKVWNATDGSHAFTYKGHSDVVDTVAWSSDGRRIASGSYDHTVQVWGAG
jgi:WD40 repeat protein/serine/threonine protein kinase